MADLKTEASTWGAPFLSLVTAVLVAVFGVIGNCKVASIETETEELRIAVDERLKEQELEIRRQALENDQKIREWAVLTEWIPRLIQAGGGDSEARAIIFVLFPNRAEQILQSAFDSLPEAERQAQQEVIDDVIQQAVDRADEVGPWSIVVASDVELEAAGREAQAALDLGFAPVRIYDRADFFVTTVGDFPRESDAESAALVLRERIRESAYVVDLARWCSTATAEEFDSQEASLFSCSSTSLE